MADSYIDYFEVSEYGNHFVSQVEKLIGASPLVDIAMVRDRVKNAVAAVNLELQKAGITRSDVRGGGATTDELTDNLRDTIKRFYHYLSSLPSGTAFDFEAFFPKGQLGTIAQLKPADVLGRGAEVLRGFASNTGLPDGTKWQTELVAAHQALDASVNNKGGAKVHSINATAALRGARESFVSFYNRVAKRLVRGVLIDLDREREFRLFFLDLQVNEGSSPASTETDTDADTDVDVDNDTP